MSQQCKAANDASIISGCITKRRWDRDHAGDVLYQRTLGFTGKLELVQRRPS